MPDPVDGPLTSAGRASAAVEASARCSVPRVHVVIMGCGRVGSTLARSLEDRDHTVSVIDSNADSFRRLGPSFGGRKVIGIGFDREVLTEAGIDARRRLRRRLQR